MAKFDPSRLWLGQIALVGPSTVGPLLSCLSDSLVASGSRREATRIQIEETKKKQRAPDCFVFVSFLLLFRFFFVFSPREIPESQICIFPWRKKNIKEQKIIKRKLIATECLPNRNKTRICKAPCRNLFLCCFFLFVVRFFPRKKCRFGIPESHEKNKNKETKKKQKQSALVQFDPFCFFFGLYFCGLLFCFFFFPIICLFPVKCSMLRHNRRPDPW